MINMMEVVKLNDLTHYRGIL